MLERIHLKTKEEWLAERRKSVGASEVAALLGINPYMGPLSVYASKIGEPENLEDKDPVVFGILFQSPIAREWARRRGKLITEVEENTLYRNTDFPYLHASPDALISADAFEGSQPGVLEVKTAAARFEPEWETGPPDHYVPQLQVGMGVMGCEYGALVCCCNFRLYEHEMKLNAELLESAKATAKDFMENHVLPRVPPDPSSQKDLARAVKLLYPRDNGETIDLPDVALDWIGARAMLKTRVKVDEERLRELEGKIKSAMKEATFGRVKGLESCVSYKHQSRKPYFVKGWEGRVLRIPDMRED